MKNKTHVMMLFLIFFIFMVYTTFPNKTQAQSFPMLDKGVVEALVNSYPMPALPTYKPSKIAEVLKEASKLAAPKIEDGIPVIARSYCLNRNPTTSGLRVHPGVIAAQYKYPLGTKVRLWLNGQSLGVYTVLDRGDRIINNPATTNIDVWHSSCAGSYAFGKRNLIMQILYKPQHSYRKIKKNGVYQRIKK